MNKRWQWREQRENEKRGRRKPDRTKQYKALKSKGQKNLEHGDFPFDQSPNFQTIDDMVGIERNENLCYC